MVGAYPLAAAQHVRAQHEPLLHRKLIRQQALRRILHIGRLHLRQKTQMAKVNPQNRHMVARYLPRRCEDCPVTTERDGNVRMQKKLLLLHILRTAANHAVLLRHTNCSPAADCSN